MISVMRKVFAYICSLCDSSEGEDRASDSSEETFTFSIDDDQISGSEVGIINGGKMDIKIFHKKRSPISRSKLDVKVKLLGSARSIKDSQRLGADIVFFFDVRYNHMMNNYYGKLKYVEQAFEFFIRKLSPIDRLSIINVSANAQMLCPLHSVTSEARKRILNQVHDHLFNGDTSSSDLATGLKMALKVLNGRDFKEGRKPTIIIFSNRKATLEVAKVTQLGDVPVHTFAVGCDFNHDVLKEVASKSNGGTFSILDFDDTEPRGNFRFVYFKCLTQLSKVAFKELEITFTPLKAKSDKEKTKDDHEEKGIDEVKIKSISEDVNLIGYPLIESEVTDSITLSFGHVYYQDMRDIKVELSLPAVEHEMDAEVLKISYSYSDGIESYRAPPVVIAVTRFLDELNLTYAEKDKLPSARPLIGLIPNKQYARISEQVQVFNENKDKIKSNQKNVNKGGYSDNGHVQAETSKSSSSKKSLK